MAEASLPATELFGEFARRLGCKPSYVTQLKNEGRLVLAEDGRRIRVAESLALIAATRDPSKEGVRERHAAHRGAGMGLPATVAPERPAGGQDAATAPEGGDDPTALDNLPASSPDAQRRAKALADREEVQARRALREEEVEMGRLLVRDQVLATVSDAIVQLRSQLEMLPITMAPALAAITDEDEVRARMRDGIEQALEQLARKFAEVGKRGTHE